MSVNDPLDTLNEKGLDTSELISALAKVPAECDYLIAFVVRFDPESQTWSAEEHID